MARQLSVHLLDSTTAAAPTRNRQLGTSMLRSLPQYLQAGSSQPHPRLHPAWPAGLAWLAVKRMG